MEPGSLNERFTFEKRPSTAPVGDGYGNFQTDFAAQFTVWTRRQFLRGGETVIAERLQGRQPSVLTIRASRSAAQITTDWRAVNARDASEVYNIRSVSLSEDRSFYDVLCERGVASG
jgi:head-tail adaptor